MSELLSCAARPTSPNVETYIPSGNVVLDLPGPGHEVQRLLEAWLEAFRGKKFLVVVAASPELDAILPANPFPEADPSRSLVIFATGASKLAIPAGQQPLRRAIIVSKSRSEAESAGWQICAQCRMITGSITP